jgi:hypothetical protein
MVGKRRGKESKWRRRNKGGEKSRRDSRESDKDGETKGGLTVRT